MLGGGGSRRQRRTSPRVSEVATLDNQVIIVLRRLCFLNLEVSQHFENLTDVRSDKLNRKKALEAKDYASLRPRSKIGKAAMFQELVNWGRYGVRRKEVQMQAMWSARRSC